MSIADLLLPRTCATCNTPSRLPLCAACAGAVDWIHPPLCERCGAPTDQKQETCSECARRGLVFDTARSAALYQGPARDVLMRFKLGGERRAARALSLAIVAAVREADRRLPAATLTFVPSTPAAIAERGFNPAEALANGAARILRWPVAPLLTKDRATPDLAKLGREERKVALAGAFALCTTPPQKVVVVDDVYTTGATANACARILKDGGATTVHVWTFARTIHWGLSAR